LAICLLLVPIGVGIGIGIGIDSDSDTDTDTDYNPYVGTRLSCIEKMSKPQEWAMPTLVIRLAKLPAIPLIRFHDLKVGIDHNGFLR
jgi:hypothetical protein